jgi:uncharacterized membrane protein YheB (UPF0754 family)
MKDTQVSSKGLAKWLDDFIVSISKNKKIEAEVDKTATINLNDLPKIVWKDETYYVQFVPEKSKAIILNAFTNEVATLDNVNSVEDVDKQGHIVDNGELYFLKNSEYLYLDNDIKRLKYLYTNEEIKIISYIFIMKYTVNFFKRHDWNNYRIHKISCSSVKEQTIIIPSVSFYYQRNMLKDDINSDIMNYCENRPQQNLPIELMKRNYNISHEKYFNVITRTTEDDIVAKRLKLNSKY